MTYQFLGRKKKWWLGISVALMIPGIIALIVWKLPFGIDFKGGANLEVKFEERNVTQTELTDKIRGYNEARGVLVAKTGEQTYSIKVLPISEDEHQAIKEKLGADFGRITETQFQSVGPSVSRDLTFKAIRAIVIASLLIIFYLAYSFRSVSFPVSSWRFGVVAVIALLHDLLITVGLFAIIAHYFHYEIDSSFITALLTVMGFSVHDTIVVFDRIRENLTRQQANNATEFEQVSDNSLGETLNRSIATSLTVILTLLSLTILGGDSIRPFVVTLLVGITVGAYSSIFTATPLLVLWQKRVFTNRTS